MKLEIVEVDMAEEDWNSLLEEHSESVNDLCKKDFEVGDVVRIVKRIPDSYVGWVDAMDDCVGMYGEVENIRTYFGVPYISVEVPLMGNWYFPPEALTMADSEEDEAYSEIQDRKLYGKSPARQAKEDSEVIEEGLSHWGIVVDELSEGPDYKFDSGKTQMSLILDDMSDAIEAVAAVATYGVEEKGYESASWKTVKNNVKRYTDAMYRHQNAEASGETWDPESGLAHAAHAAWNALALLQLKIQNGDA